MKERERQEAAKRQRMERRAMLHHKQGRRNRLIDLTRSVVAALYEHVSLLFLVKRILGSFQI